MPGTPGSFSRGHRDKKEIAINNVIVNKAQYLLIISINFKSGLSIVLGVLRVILIH